MSLADLSTWLDGTLKSRVIEALGVGYTVELREALESEVKARTAWIVLEDIDDDTRHADLMRSSQLAVNVYVTVVYEVSKSSAHYVARFAKRVATIRALTKAARERPSSLYVKFEGETGFIAEGFYLSASRLRVEFQEDVP